ncbi:MAG: histidine phosphatase family protein [Nitrospirae bacterium]|nr:histidine phosphatase family protein [Nitrospirota bacterium]
MKYLTDSPHPDRFRLFLLRHGHLENSERHVINGATDVSLSSAGQEQMAAWKRLFSGSRLDGFYSSTLSRTIDGVKILSDGGELPARAVSGFCERSFGEWEGRTREEIEVRNPEGYRRWLEIDPDFAPPMGESLRMFRERVLGTLSAIVEESMGTNFLMIGHSGVNRILILKALGLSLEHYFRISQDYACLNIIDFFRSGPAVVHLLNAPPSWPENPENV